MQKTKKKKKFAITCHNYAKGKTFVANCSVMYLMTNPILNKTLEGC